MVNRYRSGLILAVRILALAVLIGFLICLLSLFWPRFLYQEGIKQLKLRQYDRAVHYLNRAEGKVPGILGRTLARADLYRIYTHFGQAFYHKGIQDWKTYGPSVKNYALLRKGKEYLSRADAISSISYRNAYWMTLTEEALETLHQGLFPKLKNPYNAYALYLKTVSLRPAGSSIRYTYIRYLNRTKRDSDIPAAVENLMAIYPPAYYSLKSEPFYSQGLNPYLEKGLMTALEHDVLPEIAAKALSHIYELGQDYSKAVSYYLIYLQQLSPSASAYAYMDLGLLYLKQGNREESFFSFEKSLLLAEIPPKILNRIYRIFKAEEKIPALLSFLSRVRQQNIRAAEMSVTLAGIYMDMNQYDQAKEILSSSIVSKPTAAAYSLLAAIASKQKDWNGWELAAQKAVHLDRDNAAYYYSLARSLWYQHKYKRVEEETTLAIRYAPRENPWYFHLRAKARWVQKNYAPAVTDWETAFKLKPDSSIFLYNIARGYEKLARFDHALITIRKAISLDPGNEKYKALQKRLESYKP